MISSLSDLETRRQILFADGAITIRNLAGESVLVTVDTDVSAVEVTRAKLFLRRRFRACKMKAIIVDMSRLQFVKPAPAVAFAKIYVDQFTGLAFLVNNVLTKMTFSILTFKSPFKARVKTFKTFQNALRWSRTLE